MTWQTVYYIVYFLCTLGTFALACAVCALAYGDSHDFVRGGAKATLAGIACLAAALSGLALLATKNCCRLPRHTYFRMFRVFLGFSCALLVGSGIFTAAALLAHRVGNVKIPWTFIGFAAAQLVCAFASRGKVAMWFFVANIDRDEMKALLMEYQTRVRGILASDLTDPDNFPKGPRAQAAADIIVQRLRYNYQLPC